MIQAWGWRILLLGSLVACRAAEPGRTLETNAHPSAPTEPAPIEPTPIEPLTALEPRPPIFPGTLNVPASRHEFPLQTPALGGYALEKTFTNADVILPSTVAWPKVAAPPLLLDRRGYVLQLLPTGSRQVLNFASSVALSSEDGALGMALHPQFGDGTGPRPWVFVWYNARGTPRTQRLSRFTWDAATQTLPRASELVLIEEAEERALHNAGSIRFGPDGFLYFGNGDDLNTANHQRLDRALFAGIFRIDVDSRGGAVSHPPARQPAGGFTQGYFIPNDNPFVGVPNAMEEFYALGFRNPYGFSFDRQTGALWAADVGDTWREEIDLVVKGGNYEWPYREGDVLRGTTAPSLGTAEAPKFSYSHAEMGDLTSILGGFVYRGSELPELTGQYIYSDWPSCRLWAVSVNSPSVVRTTLVDNEVCNPTGLAEDEAGELYLLFVGGMSKLTRAEAQNQPPQRLSRTTVFSDVATLTPGARLVPYEVSSALWSDGAVKDRWIALPEGKSAEFRADGGISLPVGTVLVKQFGLPPRRLETRVMVVGTEETYGLTYRWNVEGTDAELVREPAREVLAGSTWNYPGFGQCWACHRAENRVLGFTPRQLNLTLADGRSQLEVLAERGVFSAAAIATMPQGIARPTDTTASLEARAEAYLAANCSSCHHPGASYLGGGETWNALPGVPLSARGLVGAQHHNGPMARALGLPSAPLIDPGEPANSLLLARMKSNNADLRMPPLGHELVDAQGVALIEAWIEALQ
jgi:glucose/arabinose dehydrogenase